MEELANIATGFSGAEIEAAVKGGVLDAFMDDGRDLTTRDIVVRVRAIRLTSEVKREQIGEPRE